MVIYIWPDGSWVHVDFIPKGFNPDAEGGRLIDLDKSHTYGLTQIEIKACLEALDEGN